MMLYRSHVSRHQPAEFGRGRLPSFEHGAKKDERAVIVLILICELWAGSLIPQIICSVVHCCRGASRAFGSPGFFVCFLLTGSSNWYKYNTTEQQLNFTEKCIISF